MSNPDPSKILFSTRYKYYLNYGSTSGSVSIPSTSYTSHTAKSYQIVIPVDRTSDYTNVKLNFSHDSSKWHNFPTADIILDSNFNIAIVGSYSSNSLVLTFYVVNQTGSTVNNTASTITANVAKFVTPV